MRITTVVFAFGLFTGFLVYAAEIKPGSVDDPSSFDTTWHKVSYDRRFGALPLNGSVENEHIPWADSYWPMQRGGMAYRWREFQDGSPEASEPASVRKKRFFQVHRYSRAELLRMAPGERSRVVSNLSPLEKYSLLIGDYDYKLVNKFLDSGDAALSSWQGYCHAWAPVSLHYPEPNPATAINADGIEIDFGSSDIKAVMISSYAERVKVSFNSFINGIGRRIGNVFKRIGGSTVQDPDATFVGQRCTKRFLYPTTKIKNGREVFSDYGDPAGIADSYYRQVVESFRNKALALRYFPEGGPAPTDPGFVQKVMANKEDPACRDVNAGAFHIVIGNQLGLNREGFLIDKTRDVEVWNQPVFRYDSQVLEWSGPEAGASPGTARMVRVKTRLFFADDTDYGWAFWFPTLPALFGLQSPFLSEYDRYQKFLIREGDQTEPGNYPEGILDYADYEYKLDLDRDGVILGGEWITFDRPDFLWLFRKTGFTGDYAKLNSIYHPVQLPDDIELRF
ncbi:MAG: hypothetical protein KGP28_03270 [Bdellovibrionales bacterium]|nr:hypothetical protein [Bdellovibrionales bacterium]